MRAEQCRCSQKLEKKNQPGKGSLLLIMEKDGRKDEFRDAIISTLKAEALVQSMKSKDSRNTPDDYAQ